MHVPLAENVTNVLYSMFVTSGEEGVLVLGRCKCAVSVLGAGGEVGRGWNCVGEGRSGPTWGRTWEWLPQLDHVPYLRPGSPTWLAK